MDIVVCGISHKTAPVEMLERLAFTPESHAGVLTQLTHCGNGNGNGNGNGSGPLAEEAVLLCTCNRVELYALMDDGATGAKKLAQFLAKYHQIPYSLMATHTYGHRGDAAVKHLFAVASGLDSMVLGEPQILGQVRVARETACAVGSAGHVLSTLFRRAIEAAKRVHTETAISQHAASVSYASVELATRELGDLSNRRVLIVGAGKTGQLTAGCLLGRGVDPRDRCQPHIGAGRRAGRPMAWRCHHTRRHPARACRRRHRHRLHRLAGLSDRGRGRSLRR